MRVNGVSREDIYFGVGGSKEYFLYDGDLKCLYFYDFVVKSKKIIIEFNGIKFHPKPTDNKYTWNGIYKGLTYDVVASKDNRKTCLAESNGWKIYSIWSDEDDILGKMMDLF